MSFLNPIALWALAGLAIPVGIHLLSRKEGKTIRMGSIRFLSETATSKFSSLKLNEVVLLMIRCTLLLFIVLFLAGLFLPTSSSSETRQWAVVENGLEKDQRIQVLLDSLSKNNYTLKKLAPTFPAFNETTTASAPDYYKLTEELSATENLKAIVIAKNRLIYFKGNRNALPKNITWLSYPVTETYVDSSPIVKTEPRDTLTITLAYAENYRYDRKILSAAVKAISEIAPQKIALNEVRIENFNVNTQTDWLFWLSDSEVNFSGNLLRPQANSFSDLLHAESKTSWTLTSRLDEKIAIENHLSIQLMNMLFGNTVDQTVIQQRDMRTISDTLAWSQKSAGILAKEPTDTSANKILLVFIVALFLLERVFAFYRKQ